MINDFLQQIKTLFIKLITTLSDLLNDLFLSIVDSVMTAVMTLVNSFVDLLDFINFSEYFDMLPPEIMQGASAIGAGQAMGIVLSAHFIKLILQLIPFVRFGAK